MGLLESAKGEIYKPVEELDLGPHSDESYVRANVKAPRMAGFLVKIFAWFLESRIFGTPLLYILKRNNLIYKLVANAQLEESPIFVPLQPFRELNEQCAKHIAPDLSPPEQVEQVLDCLPLSPAQNDASNGFKLPFHRPTIMDYHRAYTSNQTTPSAIADRLIAVIKESCKPSLNMAFFIDYNVEDIVSQARESTIRYKRGEAISILDGVPIAIKDEIDCAPYQTTGGTKWLHKFRDCKGDAACVERLRKCGAILVGKTNMHELGAGISGINPHYGACRNPYDPSKITGGSSSGSAAVVAAGLCPAALGVDGGGSVRMPAALCGVIGFKPTFGRVPHSGVLPLNWTVGMVGVLAATTEDALIVYAAINGQLSSHEQPVTMAPKLYFPLLNSRNGVSDIKLARYGEWFNDCSEDIRICCSHALDRLCKTYGWKTVDVTIPGIEAMRLAHYLTIGSECSTSLSNYLDKLDYSELGWDVRVGLCVYAAFSGQDYIKAQKLRNRQMQIHDNIFKKTDVIVAPTVGFHPLSEFDEEKRSYRRRLAGHNRRRKTQPEDRIVQYYIEIDYRVTAYPILNDALETGELDYINGAALVRYQIAGNFLGLPAITVPVGYDKLGLPIGLQFIGKPWSESTLLHIAFAMQALCNAECRRPQVFYDLLKTA